MTIGKAFEIVIRTAFALSKRAGIAANLMVDGDRMQENMRPPQGTLMAEGAHRSLSWNATLGLRSIPEPLSAGRTKRMGSNLGAAAGTRFTQPAVGFWAAPNLESPAEGMHICVRVYVLEQGGTSAIDPLTQDG